MSRMSKDFQTVNEWAFGQKGPKLNSSPVDCLRLYGILLKLTFFLNILCNSITMWQPGGSLNMMAPLALEAALSL